MGDADPRNRFASWRVAIRIARRDAWRAKGRSAMVLAMIALPILGVSAADITIRSSHLTAAQEATRQLGAADAEMSDAGNGPVPVYQDPTSGNVMSVKDASRTGEEPTVDVGAQGAPASVDLRAAMPPGARWIEDTQGYAQFKTKYGLLAAPVRELKASDPMTRGIMDLDHGRYPAARDEVMATNAFLKSAGLHVGSTVTVHGLSRTFRIVGAYDLPDELKSEQLNALPGAFLSEYGAVQKVAGEAAGQYPVTYLVTVPGDFTWQMVKQANTKGVAVDSRAVRVHKPADADVPLYAQRFGRPPSSVDTAASRAAAVVVAATVVSLAMLEICLLAGPAFAVGARRSRRQLGLVGANGGDRRHIRAIVLSGGLVIGAAAAVIGTLLGVVLTVALRPLLEDYVGKRFGGLTLRPLELLGIAALAVLTGLLAAIVPAVTSSRQSVLASLTGRRGIRHANRVLPVIGLGAICLGVGIAVSGNLLDYGSLAVGGGSGIAELGVVALTPTLVGAFGRLGRWLPLSPRLALRDSVRNRGRTAPAVAAVLAAVAGTVAVATYASSHDRENRDAYQAQLPRGTVAVASYTGGHDLTAVRSAVARRYPVAARADVSVPVYGGTKCTGFNSVAGCGNIELRRPKAAECPRDAEGAIDKMTLAQRRALSSDPRCANSYVPSAINSGSGILVGGADVLHALGIKDAAAEQALNRGESVLFDPLYADRGALTVKVNTDPDTPYPDGKEPPGPLKSLPVHVAAESLHQSYGVTVVMPRQAAVAAGFGVRPLGSFFTDSRMPNGAERQAFASDVAKIGTDAQVYLERGYTSDNSVILLALTLFAGLVTVGAAGIATGLAQADAEPDLKTLAAIGAAPRVRRMLSGFQCGVVAAMGVLLGSAAGVLPAVGLRRSERRQAWSYYHRAIDQGWATDSDLPHVPIVIPWGTLALLLVAVPVGAALLAALVTRSRAQYARRAEV